MKKLMSIIIPVYNSEKTIQRTLESLNRMSNESKEVTEVVIVDDGSYDRGMSIVEAKKDELLPLQFVIVKQNNHGTGAARNIGFKHCNGEWILFLDADDELAMDIIPFIQRAQDASAIGLSVVLCKAHKHMRTRHPVFISLENHLDVFTAGNANMASSIIFRKDRIRVLFDEKFRYMEDWLFWLTNPLIFEKMTIFLDKTSAIIHVHGENKSADYKMNGEYRKKVADKIMTELNERLKAKQKNNLLINSDIGLILSGGKVSVKTFLLFPCNMMLYLKLIIYFLLRKKFAKFDIYGG